MRPIHSRNRGVRIPWIGLGVLCALLAILVAADLVTIRVGGFRVQTGGLVNDGCYALLFLAVGAFYMKTGRSPQIATLLFVVAALVFGGPAILILDFVTKTMGYPLADAALGAADDALGLNWVAYEHWFSRHALLSLTAGFLYSGSTLVLLIAFVALAWCRRLDEMLRLAISASVTVILCTVVGGFLPAAGPHRLYGVSDGGKAYWVDTIVRVVTERPREIVLHGQPPLTTFPSYHTALGVLVIVACCRIRHFGPAFALFNLYWMLAVPVWGSHYFIDMIAGGAIALLGYGGILFALPDSARTGAIVMPQTMRAQPNKRPGRGATEV
jgi:hypothetical protein